MMYLSKYHQWLKSGNTLEFHQYLEREEELENDENNSSDVSESEENEALQGNQRGKNKGEVAQA
jgi:hypothetical protein